MPESIVQNRSLLKQEKSGPRYRTDFFFRKLTKNKQGIDYRYNEVFGHMIREQELFDLDYIPWEKLKYQVIPRRKDYFKLWSELKPSPFDLGSMFSFLYVLFLDPNIGERNGHIMNKDYVYLFLVETSHGRQLIRVSFDQGAWSFVGFDKLRERTFERGEVLLYLG